MPDGDPPAGSAGENLRHGNKGTVAGMEGIITGKVADDGANINCALLTKDGDRCDRSSPINSKVTQSFSSPAGSVPSNNNASKSNAGFNVNNGSNFSQGNFSAGGKPRSFLEAVASSAPAIVSGACFTSPSHNENPVVGKQSGNLSSFQVTPNPEMLSEIIKEK